MKFKFGQKVFGIELVSKWMVQYRVGQVVGEGEGLVCVSDGEKTWFLPACNVYSTPEETLAARVEMEKRGMG